MTTIYYTLDRHTKKLIKELREEFPDEKFERVTESCLTLRDTDSHSVLVWGTGGDHYMSHLFSETINDGFFKSIDDAHLDNDGEGYRPTGKNHVVHTEKLPKCMGVHVIVPGADGGSSDGSGISIQREDTLEGQLVHKSIDLDAAINFPAFLPYQLDTERVPRAEIAENFGKLLSRNDVIRFDIGGLHMPRPWNRPFYQFNQVADARDRQTFGFAVDCYKQLIGMYMDATKGK